MAYVEQEEAAAVRRLMRSMHSSNDTVGRFPPTATAGQAPAVRDLIASELDLRDRREGERLARKAKFPQAKSFGGYDFTQVALPEGCGVDGLRSLGFVEQAQDSVSHGQTGRGKTHLAIAIGMACAQAGKEVRFFTAAELVLMLTEANRGHCLEALLGDIAKARLTVIDELGYVPLGQEGARLLFQVMSDCYEKRSLVITTNIEFSKWGVAFGDDKLASAVIDRIMHHGRLVELNGTSKRMEHALVLGKAAI